MALQSHYYQPDLPAGIDELAMADWISALGEFPQEAVNQAVQEWLRGETRRPTPADIRARSKRRLVKPPKPDDDEYPFSPEVVPPEELARRRDMQEKLRREFPVLKKITKCEAD